MITDPSYAGQIITFTRPHIGNYGVNPTTSRLGGPFCRGVIVRELARRRSNWRAEADLDAMLRALRRPRHRRNRHPPSDPAPPRHRRHAGGVRHRRRGHAAGSGGRASPAPTASTSSPRSRRRERYTVGGGRRAAGDRLRLRHQALDPPLPVGDRHRRGRSRRHVGRRRARPPAGRCLPVQRPRRPAEVGYAVDAIARAARRGAGVRHLPRPSADGLAIGGAPTSCRSATTAATTRPPRGDRTHRDHQPEPQLLRRSGDRSTARRR